MKILSYKGKRVFINSLVVVVDNYCKGFFKNCCLYVNGITKIFAERYISYDTIESFCGVEEDFILWVDRTDKKLLTAGLCASRKNV